MPFIEREYDLDANSAEISVGGQPAITLSLGDFPEEIVRQAALYGLTKKLVDSVASVKAAIASERGVETSQVSNDDPEYTSEVVKGMQETLAQLKNGDWRAQRGEGEAKPRVTELALAISRIKGISEQEAAEIVRKVAEADKEKLAAWRKHPQVRLMIAEIRAERAAARAAKASTGEDFFAL